MPIQRQTDVDYGALCNELGVTIDELMDLVDNKDKHLSKLEDEVPLLQIVNAYRDHLKQLARFNRRSSSTLTTYYNFLNRVESYAKHRNSDLKVKEVNENMVFEILQHSQPRKSNKLATNTINKYMAIMRAILRFAFERGYIDKDLRYKMTLDTHDLLPRYLNGDQVEQVLKGALQKTYGYRKRAMIIFLLGTGCRVSEMTNLQVIDFNIEEELIFIRKAKGRKERYVPMFKEVKIAISQYLKISGVPQWRPDIKGYLFSQDEGHVREKKVLNRSVQLLVRGLFDEIGLGKDFTVHSFRHTFAVECLKAHMKEQYLMQTLGHEDPKTTSTYTKLLPSDLKDEVMKHYPFPFEDLLKKLI